MVTGGVTMNRIIKTGLWTIAITLAFTTLLFAQSRPIPANEPWDTAKNPHDFTNAYYAQNGVSFKGLIWRRTGSDGLSVFGKTTNPNQSLVRVIVTVPAYDQNGAVSYWYPLAEMTNAAFFNSEAGIKARETAKFFPMYVFYEDKFILNNTIAYTRHAPIIDDSWMMMNPGTVNPLGLREVFLVKYTEMAHSKEGAKMMDYMGQKNGRGTDGMPIINNVADIKMLYQEGYIMLNPPGEGPDKGHYAVAPLITDPTKGVIAKDAFLWMSTVNGMWLDREMLFGDQFACLQKLQTWCSKEF